MTDHAVRLHDVCKVFNPHAKEPIQAVRGLNLSIDKGEIVAFLGPNGAGKTTTLDMVLGLTEPTSGRVEVLGCTPREAVIRGSVSAVLQSGGLLGDLTVGETVHMMAHLYNRPLAPDEAMRRAGIDELAKRRVSKCSGGEQQRLRFALALLPEPDLLILDEPTAGMDVNARHAFWSTMRSQARDGRTIIFATHYLAEAEDFAERIIMIADGRLVADGATNELRELSGRRFVTFQWPGVSDLELAAIPDAADIVRNGDRVELTSDDADGVARHLLTATSATHIEITAAGLDAAFAELTADHSTL